MLIKRGLILLLAFAILAGCGSSNVNNASDADSYVAESAGISSGSSGSSLTLTTSQMDSSVEPNTESSQHDMGDDGKRQIIYTAHIVMHVKDYEENKTDIRDLIHLSGGYLLQYSETSNEKEKSGTLTIKIPADGFQSFLDQLQEMKPLKFQQNVQGEDVTEQYIDYTSRLTAQQVVEERLLKFMNDATTSSALLEFSNELARVQQSIEQLKGRITYLEQNVAYSTVTIRLSEKLDGKLAANLTFVERITYVFKGSLSFIYKSLQNIIIFIVAALPIIIMLSIIAMPIWLVMRKRWKRPSINSNEQHNND